MSEQKEMSQETRTLIAAALALAVIVAFSFLYKPQLPPNPPPQQTSPVASQTPQQQSQPQSAAIGAQITSVEPQTGVPAPAHVATAEKLVEIDTPVSRVELSNRGAIVQSWLLTKYTDDSKRRRIRSTLSTPMPQNFPAGQCPSCSRIRNSKPPRIPDSTKSNPAQARTLASTPPYKSPPKWNSPGAMAISKSPRN